MLRRQTVPIVNTETQLIRQDKKNKICINYSNKILGSVGKTA